MLLVQNLKSLKTVRSEKEPIENVCKEETPSQNSLEGDWTSLLSVTFKASQSDFFSTSGARW